MVVTIQYPGGSCYPALGTLVPLAAWLWAYLMTSLCVTAVTFLFSALLARALFFANISHTYNFLS